MRKYKRKSLRATSYSQEKLQEALTRVRNREISNRAASKIYSIPISTLHSRLHRAPDKNRSNSLGRPPAIPYEMEDKLAECFDTLKKWGWSFSPKDIMEMTAGFVRSNNIKTSFRDGKPGNEWYCNFKQRHKLSLKKPQPVYCSPKDIPDPFVVNEYFSLLKDAIAEMDLTNPGKIWNLDVTTLFLDTLEPEVVEGDLPSTDTTTDRETVTVVTAVNEVGVKLAPLIVFRGEHLHDEWMADDKNEYNFEIAYAASTRGLMESEIFYNYMSNIVIPVLAENKPAVIIFGGQRSDMDIDVVSLASEQGITILKLPAHSSHLLQPLHLAVFNSFRTIWDLKLDEWRRENMGIKMHKHVFAEEFAEAWHITTHTVIQNSFTIAGICPFNPQVIAKENYDPAAYKRWLNKKTQYDQGNSASSLLKSLLGPSAN